MPPSLLQPAEKRHRSPGSPENRGGAEAELQPEGADVSEHGVKWRDGSATSPGICGQEWQERGMGQAGGSAQGIGVDGEISPVEMLPVSPGMQGAT